MSGIAFVISTRQDSRRGAAGQGCCSGSPCLPRGGTEHAVCQRFFLFVTTGQSSGSPQTRTSSPREAVLS